MQIVAAKVARMEVDLKSWDAKLHKLRALSRTAGSEPNVDYDKRLDDVEAKCDSAEMKLDELKAGGSTKWETLRGGIEIAWREVEAGFRQLAN